MVCDSMLAVGIRSWQDRDWRTIGSVETVLLGVSGLDLDLPNTFLKHLLRNISGTLFLQKV
jgi:hypothetical protein